MRGDSLCGVWMQKLSWPKGLVAREPKSVLLGFGERNRKLMAEDE